VQPPLETSSGAATTRVAQSEHVYPSTIAPTKETAALPGRHPPARLRSWRLPVHFAPFCSNLQRLFSFRSCPTRRSLRADTRQRRQRRRRCSARRLQPAHAIPVPLARQPRVGEPPETRRRCCLPPAGARDKTKTTKTRDSLQNRRSITQDSRKWDIVGAGTL
jgi:hypothetical protein